MQRGQVDVVVMDAKDLDARDWQCRGRARWRCELQHRGALLLVCSSILVCWLHDDGGGLEQHMFCAHASVVVIIVLSDA